MGMPAVFGLEHSFPQYLLAELDVSLEGDIGVWIASVAAHVKTLDEAADSHAYVGSRAPNKFEKRVDFAAIDKTFDALQAQAAADLIPAFRRVRNRFLDHIKEKFKGEPQFVTDLTSKTFRGMTGVRVVIGKFLEQLYHAGEDSVRQELQGVKVMAASPNFIPQDALDFLAAKRFWITGIVEKDLLEKARGILLTAISSGEAPRSTQQKLHDLFEPYVGNPNVIRDGDVIKPWRLETILRTNATDAFNQGRLVQGRKAGELLTGFEYSAILDERTTPVCRRLDGKVFRADSPDLDSLKPPRHFSCRSILVPVTIDVEVEESDFVTPADVGAGTELSGVGFGGKTT